MRKLALVLTAVLMGWALQASAQTVVWEEDFEATFWGATSGNNQTLTNTLIQTANKALSVVTNPPAAFTLASGTNCILLSVEDNDYSAVRPNETITGFTASPTDSYEFSFDIYIPTALTKAVGDLQPRLKGAGGANGATLTSMTQTGPGEFHIVYSGSCADIINGTPPADNIRPFIGIDQSSVVTENFMYMDNIYFVIIPPSQKVWNGDVDDNWDTATANWQGGLLYVDGNDVLFDDTLAGSGDVDVSTTLSPSSVSILNDLQDYTFTFGPSGGIGGSALVVKDGPGTVTFTGSGQSTYTGPTAVSAGKLVLVTTGGGNSNSSFSVSSGGTLAVQSAGGGSCYVSNLTAAAGSALEIDLAADAPSTATALLSAVGDVTISGSTTIFVENGTGWTIGGTYPLIECADDVTGFENLSIGGLPAGLFGQLALSGDFINLVITPEVLTGPMIDTGFTDFEGYDDLDLAGQVNWLQVSGSSNNAFDVIDSANQGWADTSGRMVATNVGNAVYYNDAFMSNNEDDAWEGSIDLVLTAYDAGSGFADFGNQDVYSVGITTDPSASHLAWDNNMVLMMLKVGNQGNIGVNLASQNNVNDGNRLAELSQDEAGWSPKITNGLDFVSEKINFSWVIRKTRDDGIYQATAVLSNTVSGVSTETSGTFQNLSSDTTEKGNCYSSPLTYFTMGQYYQAAKLIGGVLTDPVDVMVDHVTLVHSTNNLPIPSAPVTVTTLGSDRTVKVSWSYTVEATSYDILMAETQGGPQVVVATNITDLSYFDLHRFNGVTNWYSVRANFDTGTADSLEADGVPEAALGLIGFDGINKDMVTENISWTRSGVGSEGILNWFGSDTVPIITNGQASYVGPTLYAWVQNPENENFGNTLIQNNGNSSSYSGIDWIEVASQHQDPRARQHMLVYVKSEDWDNDPSPLDLSAEPATLNIGSDYCNGDYGMKAAIRNGSQWYVSDVAAIAKWSDPQSNIVINLGETLWAPITFVSNSAFWNPAGLTYTVIDTNAFTDVNAVGYYCYEDFKARVNQLILSKGGSSPSPIYWAGNNGVTDLYANNDTDHLINIKEYAFGGDPNDGNDLGILKQYELIDYNGTNGFIYVHAESRDPEPGIIYSVETTESLFLPYADGDAVYLGEEPIDYYFKSVTNFIPADAEVLFIDVKISETP